MALVPVDSGRGRRAFGHDFYLLLKIKVTAKPSSHDDMLETPVLASDVSIRSVNYSLSSGFPSLDLPETFLSLPS
jgi:hypothetical protein